jgi:superoxide reductase
MKKENIKFLYCEHCGNLVEMIEDSGVDIICCGEEMTGLVAKTADTGVEKHLPKVEKDGDLLKVTVGEVLHPMTDKHSIQWIAVVEDDRIQRVDLNPTDEPKAQFHVKGDADVYAYCNLHGLWKTSA